MALLETMHIEGHDYTFAQLRHFTEKVAGIRQEGIVTPGDYLVSQRGAGANMSADVAAGDAYVKMDTGTRNGLYFQTNDGVVNVVVGAAHATLPRLDQLVLQVNDSNVTGVIDTAELKIIPGTATSGATLDNRTGAAALGNDRIRLADILVPAAAVSIVTANIRDRRPWATLGRCNVATEETRNNTVLGFMPTADLVSGIDLPTDGLIAIAFQGLMKSSIGAAGRADVFIDGNEIKWRNGNVVAAPGAQARGGPGGANEYGPISTWPLGLYSDLADGVNASSDVTTGQAVGLWPASNDVQGGVAYVFAAAGVHDISVLWAATAGTVTAKERKLWAWRV